MALVLIAGGSGFVGRALTASLLAAGDEVVLLSRNPAPDQSKPRVADYDHIPRGADLIVNLAGASVAQRRLSKRRKRELRDSRILTTARLVEAMRVSPPRAFVSASAIGFYGDRGEETLDENSPPGTGFLAELAREWEHTALQAQAQGVRTVLLRIGVVLGDGAALAKMRLPFRFGLGARLGDGQQWFSWIHIDDLVRLIAFSAAHPTLSGPLNAVSPCPVRNSEFTRELARALKRPAFLRVPAWALKLALGEFADTLLASQRVLPARAQAEGFVFAFPDLAKALGDILSQPRPSA